MAWYIVLVLCVLCGVEAQNCRGEDTRERGSCENLCDEHGNCTVRAALLLPRNPFYEVSLSIVDSTLELSMQMDAVKQAFPDWVNFEWMSYDVEDCEAAYAVIGAIDAYNDCAHVFFGPSCDFALAAVARIIKFLGSTGTPMLTTGGFSYDFVEPKQNCSGEFYMLVRAGPQGSFKDLALFLIAIMRKSNRSGKVLHKIFQNIYKTSPTDDGNIKIKGCVRFSYFWSKLLLITEPESQVNVAGQSSCHLMMKTFANYLKKQNIIYVPWDTTSDAGLNYTENLKNYLDHKFGWNRVMLLYDTPAYQSQVGDQGGFLLANNIHMYMTLAGISAFGREMQPTQSHEDLLLQNVGNDFASELRFAEWVWNRGSHRFIARLSLCTWFLESLLTLSGSIFYCVGIVMNNKADLGVSAWSRNLF